MSFPSSQDLVASPIAGLSLSPLLLHQEGSSSAPISFSQFHPEPSSASICLSSASFPSGSASSQASSSAIAEGKEAKDAKSDASQIIRLPKRKVAKMFDDEYESLPVKTIDLKAITLIPYPPNFDDDPELLVLKVIYEEYFKSGDYELALKKNEECQELISQLAGTQQNFPFKEEMAKLLYNQGVIAAKLKDYQKASDSFEEAGIFFSDLRKSEEMKRCEENRDALLELFISDLSHTFMKSFRID